MAEPVLSRDVAGGNLAEDILDISLSGGIDVIDLRRSLGAGAVRIHGHADGNWESSGAHRAGGIARENEAAVGDDAAEFLREEEEGLVAAVIELAQPDRPADGVAVVVVVERGTLEAAEVVGEAVGGVVVAAIEFVQIAVQQIGSALCNQIDLAAGAAPELRAVGIADGLEFRDGIDAGVDQQRVIRAAIDVVRSVHGPRIGAAALSVDGKRDHVGFAGRIRQTDIELIAAAVGDARLQANHLFVVAVIQRQIRPSARH